MKLALFLTALLVAGVMLVWAETPASNGYTNTTGISNSSELRDPEQVEEAANVMFKEYWEMVLRDEPETATSVGDHRYNDRLSSYSLKCFEKRKVMLNEFMERANQLLPLASEGSETQNNIQLFISNLQYKLEHLMSGAILFPVTKLGTPSMSLRFLLMYHSLNDSQDYWNVIKRYESFPQQVNEKIELLREGIRISYTLHEISLPRRDGAVNQSVEESPFYKPFAEIPSNFPPEEIEAIQVNASNAIRNSLYPAIKNMDDFIQNEYRQHTRSQVGVSSLPNGEEYYLHELAFHLTDKNVTPAEIYEMGKSEVERISREMEEVIHSLGLNMTTKEFADSLRNNESMFFSTEEEALQTYRDTIFNVIYPKLPTLFKTIPGKPLVVEKVPPEMSTGPRAYYTKASPDNTTSATFFLDTTSLKNLPRYELMTLSIHEAVPGHHFQLSYAMEQQDFPDFRKHDIDSNAFVEGWALYAEFLGYELDLYGDPYMLYGHLSEEIFRACRLVVDTGIHVMGWRRQEAIDYMMNNSAATLNNIEREVDRYISWPGQACAYKYGEQKIIGLRRKAENALGGAFDVKEFHDVILRNAGPLDIVEKQVNRYIEQHTSSQK